MNVLPPPGPERTRAVSLLVLLLAVLGWMLWPSPPSSPGPQGLTAPTAAVNTAPRDQNASVPASAAQANALPPEMRLADLDLATEAPGDGRNLFRYGVRPSPPPPPRPANQGPVVPPPPPQPTGPPPVPLRLTGLATLPGEQRVATLTDRDNGAVFQAVEGQVVDGRYRIVKIGLQSAVVSYVDGSGQRTIPLGGG